MYICCKNNTKSREYYLKSLEMDIEMDNKQGMGLSYNNIGETYLKEGNYKRL
jgi:hypothetical protein